jgi:hypothetical protein
MSRRDVSAPAVRTALALHPDCDERTRTVGGYM